MIEARFRHRATSETAEQFHTEVVACLRNVPWLWKDSPIGFEFETNGESAACDLTPYLRKGVFGSISYSARYGSSMKDKAMFDDVLTLQIDENAIDYTDFVSTTFEEVVKCFRAYRAAIVLDLDLDLDDFDQIAKQSRQTGQDIDGRDTVFRINPINYFDQELCKRAFEYSVDEIKCRLADEVEKVVTLHGGLLLVVTSDHVDRDNLKQLHDHVASLLDMESEVPG